MWIMAYALSDPMSRKLQKLYKKEGHPDVISKINWQIFFLKNNGEVLTNMTLLKKEDPEHFEFFAIDPLSEYTIPQKIQSLSDFMAKNNLQDIDDALIKSSLFQDSENLRRVNIKYERLED